MIKIITQHIILIYTKFMKYLIYSVTLQSQAKIKSKLRKDFIMRNQTKYILITTIAVSFLGTLMHFLYDFLGQNHFIGLFSPINESTWEHMKLIFFPMLVCNIRLYRKLSHINTFVSHTPLFAGTLLGTWLIPVLFYTYRGVLGYEISAIDISTFYISVVLSYTFIWHTVNGRCKKCFAYIIYTLCIIQLLAFIYFTYSPGNIGIFQPPVPK